MSRLKKAPFVAGTFGVAGGVEIRVRTSFLSFAVLAPIGGPRSPDGPLTSGWRGLEQQNVKA